MHRRHRCRTTIELNPGVCILDRVRRHFVVPDNTVVIVGTVVIDPVRLIAIIGSAYDVVVIAVFDRVTIAFVVSCCRRFIAVSQRIGQGLGDHHRCRCLTDLADLVDLAELADLVASAVPIVIGDVVVGRFGNEGAADRRWPGTVPGPVAGGVVRAARSSGSGRVG